MCVCVRVCVHACVYVYACNTTEQSNIMHTEYAYMHNILHCASCIQAIIDSVYQEILKDDTKK